MEGAGPVGRRPIISVAVSRGTGRGGLTNGSIINYDNWLYCFYGGSGG